jgi:hypothetical protein
VSQKIRRYCRQNPEGNFAGMNAAGISDFALGIFNLCQNFLCPPDENQARFRWNNPTVISVQEKFPNPDFQLLNLHAQGWLGDVAARGSFAKTAKLRDRQIISQLSYIHSPA